MDVIKNYLDNVFAAYPQTDEVQQVRRDMLANMEEKYQQLRQSGKSEHEAAYGVIADFGDIEELTSELGLSSSKKEDAEALSLTLEDAKAYLKKSKLYGILVGLGVWLIIAGVSTVVALTGEDMDVIVPVIVDARDNSVLFLFPAVAVAVVMFIAAGALIRRYGKYAETHIVLAASTREWVDRKWSKFAPFYTIMIAGGVALIILAVGAMATFALPVPAFLNAVGFAVFMFVAAGSYGSAFDILRNEGEYSNKAAAKKSGDIIGGVAAVYWPVTTAIFLWLLLTGVDNFWVIWPVAGVLFGGICGGIYVWFASKGKG